MGLVEPKQLPKEFIQITKNLLVLIGLLGPTISSHHPVEGSSLDEHACAEGDNPVKIRTQFDLSEDRVPQVSYAITGFLISPRFIRNVPSRVTFFSALKFILINES